MVQYCMQLLVLSIALQHPLLGDAVTSFPTAPPHAQATQPASTSRVFTLGEAMVLLTAKDGKPLSRTSSCSLAIAGAESNVALYLSDAGVSVSWLSAVGADPFGVRMLEYLAGHGVDTSLVLRDEQRHTGVFFKDQNPQGTTVHYYRADSAASAMGYTTLERLQELLKQPSRVEMLHLSGITAALSQSCRSLLAGALLAAREASVPVSFDVNHRPGLWSASQAGPILQELANQADVVFVGLDEAEELWGLRTPEQIRSHLPGAAEVVVKDGGNGATWLGKGGEEFVPAPKVDVVEVVGAGDAFAAGFLASRLTGEKPSDQLANGHRFAERAMSSTADFRSLADFASAQDSADDEER